MLLTLLLKSPRQIPIPKSVLKAIKEMSDTTTKNLCFTKYDQSRLKIIDIGANLSGNNKTASKHLSSLTIEYTLISIIKRSHV